MEAVVDVYSGESLGDDGWAIRQEINELIRRLEAVDEPPPMPYGKQLSGTSSISGSSDGHRLSGAQDPSPDPVNPSFVSCTATPDRCATRPLARWPWSCWAATSRGRLTAGTTLPCLRPSDGWSAGATSTSRSCRARATHDRPAKTLSRNGPELRLPAVAGGGWCPSRRSRDHAVGQPHVRQPAPVSDRGLVRAHRRLDP